MRTYGAERVVVLGGNGFLGKHVRAAFTARGDRVLTIARHPVPGADSVRMDLVRSRVEDLAEVLVRYGATAVVNAAGAVWDSGDEDLEKANVALVERLRDAVARVPRPPRVIQLGTVFEYSDPEPGRPLTEGSPCLPSTPYGRSKLEGGEVVLDASAQGLFEGVVLRATTCVGPGLPPESLLGLVAAELRAAERHGRSAEIRLRPLTAERDFLDCRDLAAAVVSASAAPVVGRAVNLGSGVAVNVRRPVDLLIKESGVAAELIEEGTVTGRSAGIDWLAVHAGLAERLLGWRPRHGLDSTVRSIWAEAITNSEEGPDSVDGYTQ